MERDQHALATTKGVEALLDDVARIQGYDRFIVVFDKELGIALSKLRCADLQPSWARALIVMATKEAWSRTELIRHTSIGNGVSYATMRLELMGFITTVISAHSSHKRHYYLSDKGRTLVAQLAVLLTEED